MKPLLVTSGEPAGVGPDICLALAGCATPLVVLGDQTLLQDRAHQLGRTVKIKAYSVGAPLAINANELYVWHLPVAAPVKSGELNSANAAYVMQMLQNAVDAMLRGEFAALVTAPVHKQILNQAGFVFRGHTEFLAHHCGVRDVVMLMSGAKLKIALVTTHIALRQVPQMITSALIQKVVRIVNHALQMDFLQPAPKILVAGLNPHAGEGGYLGKEEIAVIQPAIKILAREGINIHGPFAADTLFQQAADVFITMYHDQGLPVIKYTDFAHSVNVTLGLPIIRTSVDHGTALELAGTGLASPESLMAAVNLATIIQQNRAQSCQ